MKKQLMIMTFGILMLFSLISMVSAQGMIRDNPQTTLYLGNLSNLYQLNDTNIPSPSNLNLLQFQTSNNKWNSYSFSLGDFWDYDYNDLINTPTIPTNNNQLINGNGYYNLTDFSISDYTLLSTLNNGTYANNWVKSGSNIYYNSGNVSIGTTTPQNTLNVIGDGNFTGNLYSNGQLVGAGKVSGSGTYGYIPMWNDTDSLNNSPIYTDGTQVGIGTTSPGTKFEVKYNDGGAKGSIRALDESDSDFTSIDPNFGLMLSRSTSYINNLKVGGDILFRVSESTSLDNDGMIIKNTGNVGIGTVSPNTKLDVRGDMLLYDAVLDTNLYLRNGGASNNSLIWWQDSSGGNDYYFGQTNENGNLKLYSYIAGKDMLNLETDGDIILGGDQMFLDNSSGNVGIGTTSPSYPLEINGDSSGISLYTSGNISATGFITRTTLYNKEKSVWDYIKDTDYYKDKDGKIEHSKYYGYVQNISSTDYSKPINESYEEEVCEQILINVTVEKCNWIEDLFTNCTNIIEEKLETQCHNEIRTRITYPYTKQEEGVNLEDEINLLRQAVFELKQQNDLLLSRIEVLENVK